MRRIVIIGTALAVLLAAVSAYAAASGANTYTAKLSFSPSRAGSRSKPSPLAFVENYAAKGASGNRAAPLVDIKTTIYGMVSNAKYFPTCSAAKIEAAKNDNVCNPRAMVASGPVTAMLGPTDLTKPGTPCDPLLHVWNGGPGKLVFFFITNATHTCGGLHTGATAPYPGFVRQQGNNLVTDVPLPPDVSTRAGNQTGVYGSLIQEVLTWRRLITKVHGKAVAYNASVACKNGKRPWSVKFTAVNNGVKQSSTVSGASKC